MNELELISILTALIVIFIMGVGVFTLADTITAVNSLNESISDMQEKNSIHKYEMDEYVDISPFVWIIPLIPSLAVVSIGICAIVTHYYIEEYLKERKVNKI